MRSIRELARRAAILYGAGAPIVLAVNSTGDDLSTLAPS